MLLVVIFPNISLGPFIALERQYYIDTNQRPPFVLNRNGKHDKEVDFALYVDVHGNRTDQGITVQARDYNHSWKYVTAFVEGVERVLQHCAGGSGGYQYRLWQGHKAGSGRVVAYPNTEQALKKAQWIQKKAKQLKPNAKHPERTESPPPSSRNKSWRGHEYAADQISGPVVAKALVGPSIPKTKSDLIHRRHIDGGPERSSDGEGGPYNNKGQAGKGKQPERDVNPYHPPVSNAGPSPSTDGEDLHLSPKNDIFVGQDNVGQAGPVSPTSHTHRSFPREQWSQHQQDQLRGDLPFVGSGPGRQSIDLARPTINRGSDSGITQDPSRSTDFSAHGLFQDRGAPPLQPPTVRTDLRAQGTSQPVHSSANVPTHDNGAALSEPATVLAIADDQNVSPYP